MTKQEKEVLINDVTLYIENDGDLYREAIIPICKSLARKKYRKAYDDEKSKKAWYNVAVWGLKRYHKYIYDGPGHWYDILTTSERRQVADELQAFYADDIAFEADRLIKEHEKPSLVGVVKSCVWQRNDINGNATYKIIVVRDDNMDVVTGTSQDAQCFNGWLEGKKVKAFYHVTKKRRAVKFDEFQLL